MIEEDKEKEVYKKIRMLKKGNLIQREVAIKCEKILADECSDKDLNEKLIIVINIINNIK